MSEILTVVVIIFINAGLFIDEGLAALDAD